MRVGARFIVHLVSGGRGVATPHPFGRPAAAAVERAAQPYPRQLGQHVVLPLPEAGGCDVIASLPKADPTTRHLKRFIRSKGDRKPEGWLG